MPNKEDSYFRTGVRIRAGASVVLRDRDADGGVTINSFDEVDEAIDGRKSTDESSQKMAMVNVSPTEIDDTREDSPKIMSSQMNYIACLHLIEMYPFISVPRGESTSDVADG